jgi:hypothetical protein
MSTVKQYYINGNGLEQIQGFLGAHHKKGGDHFDEDMLRAWAADAEFCLSEGNPAIIEIKSWEAVSGHTETFTIGEDGIGCEEIEFLE